MRSAWSVHGHVTEASGSRPPPTGARAFGEERPVLMKYSCCCRGGHLGRRAPPAAAPRGGATPGTHNLRLVLLVRGELCYCVSCSCSSTLTLRVLVCPPARPPARRQDTSTVVLAACRRHLSSSVPSQSLRRFRTRRCVSPTHNRQRSGSLSRTSLPRDSGPAAAGPTLTAAFYGIILVLRLPVRT